MTHTDARRLSGQQLTGGGGVAGVLGHSGSVPVASMELRSLLCPRRDLQRRSGLFSPTGPCCVLSMNASSLASHCLPCLLVLLSKVAFWFPFLFFLFFIFCSFSENPSRHSHTRTDPTSPRCAIETATIQERCVSLPTAALHLCPLTSALLFALLTLSVAARPHLYSRNDDMLVL